MNLEELSLQFRVLAKAAGAQESELDRMRAKCPNVPQEYVALAREVIELELQHEGGAYLRIWGPLGCLEMDEGYGISMRMPGAVPIGDNGGGRVLSYVDGKNGAGLYIVGYGDLDIDDATWVASDLRELLAEAHGVVSLL